jgi:SAM-dependent methyltransferase
MIAACRERLPGGVFAEGDIRDLSRYEASWFDAVVAAYNTLDELDPAGREQTLAEAARVSRPGGLFYMSAHNRHFLPRVHGPARFTFRTPRDLAANLVAMPLRIRNHMRLRRLQRVESDYALVNDNAHNYALLHYYVTPQAQVRQLEAHGFEPLEVLDLECRTLGPEERAEGHVFVHYVARRRG